jgi:hypothetical protein
MLRHIEILGGSAQSRSVNRRGHGRHASSKSKAYGGDCRQYRRAHRSFLYPNPPWNKLRCQGKREVNGW